MSALRVVSVDIITTCTLGLMASMRGSAVVPSSSGISMSSRTTSGSCLAISSRAIRPFEAVPTSSRSGLADPAGDEAAHHGRIVGHQDTDRRGR